MKVRIIPYGYLMSNGDISPHLQEAEIVKCVFTSYCAGATYQEIADNLMEQRVRYSEDKDYWNKMMIQRLLENRRYIGEQGFPAIIDKELFDRAQAVRAAKPSSRKFHHRKSRNASQEYHIGVYTVTPAIRRMTNEINRALEKSPDPEVVKPMIFACAAEKYNSIGGAIKNG